MNTTFFIVAHRKASPASISNAVFIFLSLETCHTRWDVPTEALWHLMWERSYRALRKAWFTFPLIKNCFPRAPERELDSQEMWQSACPHEHLVPVKWQATKEESKEIRKTEYENEGGPVARQVRVFALKPEDLSSVSRTHTVALASFPLCRISSLTNPTHAKNKDMWRISKALECDMHSANNQWLYWLGSLDYLEWFVGDRT